MPFVKRKLPVSVAHSVSLNSSDLKRSRATTQHCPGAARSPCDREAGRRGALEPLTCFTRGPRFQGKYKRVSQTHSFHVSMGTGQLLSPSRGPACPGDTENRSHFVPTVTSASDAECHRQGNLCPDLNPPDTDACLSPRPAQPGSGRAGTLLTGQAARPAGGAGQAGPTAGMVSRRNRGSGPSPRARTENAPPTRNPDARVSPLQPAGTCRPRTSVTKEWRVSPKLFLPRGRWGSRKHLEFQSPQTSRAARARRWGGRRHGPVLAVLVGRLPTSSPRRPPPPTAPRRDGPAVS